MTTGYTYLIIEPACGVKILKVFGVCFRAPEFQIGNLKITPHWPFRVKTSRQLSNVLTLTKVPWISVIIRDKSHRIIWGEILRVFLDEIWRVVSRSRAQRRERLPIVVFHNVPIVRSSSGSVIVNPYSLLFSCINTNGSSSTSHTNSVAGLQISWAKVW